MSIEIEGMTLQDWYAGMALNAIIQKIKWNPENHYLEEEVEERIALEASCIAETMMRKRNKCEDSNERD